MSAPFVSEALVLGAIPYAEADRVVTLFTRTHGKVSAMARGARKSRRRFGGALALFVLGDATLRDRRGAELYELDRFDARRDFSPLSFDVVRMAQASYATELLRELTAPRHADPTLLDLLVELYAAVAQPEVDPRADTLRAFELHLLDEIGLRPVLDRCLACGAEDDATLDHAGSVVDIDRGGLLCPSCARTALHGSRPMPPAARRRLLELRELTIARAAALPAASTEVDATARAAMHALVGSHLRVPMRSLQFIQKLRAAR